MKVDFKVNFENLLVEAKTLAKTLRGGEVLALNGKLGSGKTTFIKTVLKNLGVKKKVQSPTFTLMRSYPVRLKNGKKITFYHLDIYRCRNFTEVSHLGLEELWQKTDTIVAIEWADKIKSRLPKKTVRFNFQNPYEKSIGL
jgi:tRNA threonylcarbamoyladenosine biosynthesis protein TsaE